MSAPFLCILAVLALHSPAAVAEGGGNPACFHIGFEDFGFLDEDIIARSGLKTVEDRGLELVEGRFGKGLYLSKETRIVEQDEMTGVDLDMVTAVVFNTRHRREHWDIYNEPFLWGAGRFNSGSGAVAFWVKGEVREGMLFEQSAMAWGRKEKFLLAVTIDGNGRPGAYITDSRYVRHTIQSDTAWRADRWNHVVLNWDRTRGLELFLNGKTIASSWGKDAWWQAPLPGLFHLPMEKTVYDELYIFPRPLAEPEITALMENNAPPEGNGIPEPTTEERDRLAGALGLSHALSLPAVEPMEDGRVLSFKEITPEFMGDGHVPGRFCQDGRYELAWPHQIATFTIVPGDADFQAEKLDVVLPEGVPFNYVTIEGNLDGMPSVLLDAVKENDRYTGRALFTIPRGQGFFFGTGVERKPYRRFTLPFLKGYGAPGEFTGDVKLPLTGATRIHEVGIFDVTEKEEERDPCETVYYFRTGGDLAYRYDFALKTMESVRDRRKLHGYLAPPEGDGAWYGTGFLERTHLITTPMTGMCCVGAVVLDMTVRTKSPEDILLVRLHDPGTPHRIWTHAEVKLRGFDGDGGRMRLMLDFPSLMLAEGDVVWLDIATYDGAEILVGGNGGARIVLKPAPYLESVKEYETKALMPTMAEYMKAYHHQPWLFEKIWPDIMNPHSIGGQFDSIMPALAVKRLLPHSRLAEYYIEWAKPKYYWGSFVDPEKNFPIKHIEVPDGVPRWAYLQHVIQNFRYRVTDFLVENQNPDGQLWGGWNDDTLILRGRPDIPLDGHYAARDMFLKIYEGLDRTNIFGGGYCRIRPIDNVHNGDFVRERYKALIFKLGDPYIYRRALETAWHWDKPDETPYNWGGGKPFLFDKNTLEWYWGKRMPHTAYKTWSAEKLDENLSRLASYCDDILFHRFTEARMHADASRIYNEQYVVGMILGGNADETISVAWPEGGGKDLARWVTYADSTKLVCRMFSFRPLERDVTARLFRIEPGTYRIVLSRDENGSPGTILHTEKKRMKRFDTFTVPVPPGTPVLLTVEQVKKDRNAGPLPDLAVAPYDCDRKGNTLSIRVSNLGAKGSKKTVVHVYDTKSNKIGQAKVPGIEAPTDFVNKSNWVDIHNLPRKGTLVVVVDPKDRQKEILEENNRAVIP